jgi:hypothetical protein
MERVKMTKPIILIHNTETNEIIEREMDTKEFAQYKANLEANKTKQIEAEAKEVARAAILDRLGLTADEAAILLG